MKYEYDDNTIIEQTQDANYFTAGDILYNIKVTSTPTRFFTMIMIIQRKITFFPGTIVQSGVKKAYRHHLMDMESGFT